MFHIFEKRLVFFHFFPIFFSSQMSNHLHRCTNSNSIVAVIAICIVLSPFGQLSMCAYRAEKLPDIEKAAVMFHSIPYACPPATEIAMMAIDCDNGFQSFPDTFSNNLDHANNVTANGNLELCSQFQALNELVHPVRPRKTPRQSYQLHNNPKRWCDVDGDGDGQEDEAKTRIRNQVGLLLHLHSCMR
jgi:hypothetical protein